MSVRDVSYYARLIVEVASFLDYSGEEHEFTREQATAWSKQVLDWAVKLCDAVYLARKGE